MAVFPAYTAIVLAAQRQGGGPLSAVTGGKHKCLLDIQGRPMITWVLETLLSAPMIKQTLISIEDESTLDGIPQLADTRVTTIASGNNLYASVERALSHGNGQNYPVIITTADNPLLTVEMLTHFCSELEDRQVDAAAAMTRAGVMRARYPDGQRRFHAFRDDTYSNCNLYGLNNARARAAAKIFRGGGQFGKSTTRILRALGLRNLILYKTRVLSLAQFARRLSGNLDVNLGFIELPFAEAPIDVDNERTLELARAIIGQRQQAAGSDPA